MPPGKTAGPGGQSSEAESKDILKTVSGRTLWAMMRGKSIDEKGAMSMITKNGVIHVVDTVLMPN
jgi:hypothetical protein